MSLVWKRHRGTSVFYGLLFRHGWFIGVARDFRAPAIVFVNGHFDHFEEEQ